MSGLQDKRLLIAGGPGHAVELLAHEAAKWGAKTACIPEAGEIDPAFEAALQDLSSIDVLVYLMPEPMGPPVLDLSDELWRDQIAATLKNCFLTLQVTLEEFLCSQVPGRIVLVVNWPDPKRSSDEPQFSFGEVLQEAVRSLARSLAKEYGRRGIACNVIDVSSGLQDSGSSKQFGSIWECIYFLADSQASSFVNGESLRATVS